ncbi:hypothetical protein LEP1GSC178_2351 [Leptospira licerasiae str. MMD4847]|uniref:Uncharacterized protein n=1 Tax=Leptospira licerasiae str. MMD4847 TaxID=1049971 RepID=A0ABN0HEC9_9LEPT|nr:hypothetical protein LEP1GSC178_2351 [Leptospira licerasiae str. MMD4847]
MPFILFIVSKFELLKLNRKVPPEILIGPFFIYAVLLYFFKSESKIIKSFIRQLLDAKG